MEHLGGQFDADRGSRISRKSRRATWFSTTSGLTGWCSSDTHPGGKPNGISSARSPRRVARRAAADDFQRRQRRQSPSSTSGRARPGGATDCVWRTFADADYQTLHSPFRAKCLEQVREILGNYEPSAASGTERLDATSHGPPAATRRCSASRSTNCWPSSTHTLAGYLDEVERGDPPRVAARENDPQFTANGSGLAFRAASGPMGRLAAAPPL